MKSDDRLLFLGNPQQSVPKRLLLARNLSPRDKFAWQLLRLHARDDGSGVFPSYNELQGWPCAVMMTVLSGTARFVHHKRKIVS